MIPAFLVFIHLCNKYNMAKVMGCPFHNQVAKDYNFRLAACSLLLALSLALLLALMKQNLHVVRRFTERLMWQETRKASGQQLVGN